MNTCDAGRIGQKTAQFPGNLYFNGNPFLVVFHVFENSDPSREIYLDFSLVTTVNEGSTRIPMLRNIPLNLRLPTRFPARQSVIEAGAKPKLKSDFLFLEDVLLTRISFSI